MGRSLARVYVHLVWTTYGRIPLLVPDLRFRIYRQIMADSKDADVSVLAIGGVDDHIHALVRLPTKLSIAEYVQQIKGRSSFTAGPEFKWGSGFGAFSIAIRDIPKVTAYIEKQDIHHTEGTIKRALELTNTDEVERRTDGRVYAD